MIWIHKNTGERYDLTVPEVAALAMRAYLIDVNEGDGPDASNPRVPL